MSAWMCLCPTAFGATQLICMQLSPNDMQSEQYSSLQSKGNTEMETNEGMAQVGFWMASPKYQVS
jgi:hypothetical protein